MKLLIVTDAWHPQVNGVVRTLSETVAGLERRGWDVKVVGPSGLTLPCPTYPEIRLSLQPKRTIQDALKNWRPDSVHIATEGPLGLAMRSLCLERDWPFTTSFHTRFPEYLKMRFGLPAKWTYEFLRRFHAPAARVLVPSASIQKVLSQNGIAHAQVWGRGVDTELFRPDRRSTPMLRPPIYLYVGRLAVEKNIDTFLQLAVVGTKIVVGDGPERRRLQRQYRDTVFRGPLYGEKLAQAFASADVFVFPSRTDTFGLVLLEALASGTPVAAFPEPGPIDVLQGAKVGILSEDLKFAVTEAMKVNRDDCRAFGVKCSWEKSVETFERALEIIRSPVVTRPSFSTLNWQMPRRFDLDSSF